MLGSKVEPGKRECSTMSLFFLMKFPLDQKLTLNGSRREDKNMKNNRSGFTLVEIMIVVAIIALLAAIAIPNLLRAKMSSNDALAQATIRAISTATESFGTANSGNYPTDIASLTNATPPYINAGNAPCTQTQSGYTYTCTFGVAGYTFSAVPVTLGTSGTTTYTITTGGVLTP